jgi:F-type H+-transporting ATPase subunit gamma
LPGAGLKAINKRIRSVRSTQQITKAMKMVSAAKLQRAQARMLAGRPYSRKLTELLEQLAAAGSAEEAASPLFAVRPVQRRLYVVITSDKGLAGSYNANILRLTRQEAEQSRDQSIATEIYAIGKKGRDFFRKREFPLWEEHIDFGGQATPERARLVGERVVGAFLDGTFDEIRLVYAQFTSTVRQVAVDQRLLPIAQEEAATRPDGASGRAAPATQPVKPASKAHRGHDYIWEPGQKEILDLLLPLYLRNRIYMTLSEAFVSEHAARMTSMTAATDNAGDLIDALTLKRNRERQAAITSELSDIVGGANAL